MRHGLMVLNVNVSRSRDAGKAVILLMLILGVSVVLVSIALASSPADIAFFVPSINMFCFFFVCEYLFISRL